MGTNVIDQKGCVLDPAAQAAYSKNSPPPPRSGQECRPPMPFRSLRDFLARLEAEGKLVRVSAPVSPHLEMTEIQTRLLAEGGPAVLFENPVREDDGRPYGMPVLVNLFGTVDRVAMGMDRRPDQLRAVGEDVGLPQAAGAAERDRGYAQAPAAAPHRAGDEAQDRATRAVPGRGVDRRRHRPVSPAGPGLLARRAGAADHLAAGGDQGAGRREDRRGQPRHLPHAGDRARYHPDALAQAPWRSAALPPLGQREA